MTGRIVTTRRLDKNAEWEYATEYLIDGQAVTREAFKKAFPDREGVPGGMLPSCWPLVSEAMAVHPRQVKQAREKAERLGVPTHFKETGEPVFRSPEHRAMFCEAHGTFDRNGGDSDPQPK